jgi:hypothetical protein
MNPRTLCACQSVAFMISVRVGGTLRSADHGQDFRALAFGVRRGSLSGFALAGLAGFWLLLGRGRLGLGTFSIFWPVGASFFRVARFFEEACFGASRASCYATLAAVLAFALVMLVCVSFVRACWRMAIHHSGPLKRARQKATRSAII